MSSPSETPGQPQSAPPPDPPTSLGVGTRIADRFEIRERLGHSEQAISYLATDYGETGNPTVAAKLLDPGLQDLFEKFEARLKKAHKAKHRSLSRLVDFGHEGDHPYIVLEYVKGQTLQAAIEKKQQGHTRFMPRTVLSLLTPVCHALSAAHEQLPHGALTPRNVYVERNGRVRIANLGFGWLMGQALAESGQGATADSPFIAPEVRDDPSQVSVRGDVYSLGMIAIALLAGRTPSLDSADALAHRLLEQMPQRLQETLGEAISDSPAARPAKVSTLFEELQKGIEDLRDQLIELKTQEHEPLVEPELKGPSETPGLLEGLLVTDELPPVPEDGDDPAVWLVHRDGFDYGPYSSEQVREQLLQDKIHEHCEIRNLQTEERGWLEDIDEFAEFVADYIPVREERRKREEERRAEVQRRVKRASATGIITLVVAVLALIGLYIYYLNYIRVKPEEVAFHSLFARVGRDFAVPGQGYVSIAADADLMAALFNFDEEIEEPEPRRRRRHDPRTTPEGENPIDPENPADNFVDFSQAGGNRRLTQADINDTILSDARPIRRCLEAEIGRNRSFSGTQMRFVVRPDGRTQGVNLGSGNYTEDLRSCLTPIFRRMRFPPHDDFNLPVSFPFNVR